MNPLQMALQIRHKLRTVAWAGGSQEVVFGTRSVFVFAGAPPTDEQIPAGFPFALVSIDGGTPDEDAPDLIEQQFTVVTAAEVAGDPLGEFAIIGGSTADLGHSAGRGVAEVAERVRSAVEDLVGVDGAKILLSATATGTPVPLGNGRHLALDELTLTALCTSAPHFAAPQQIANSGAAWSWSGAHCSARFDFLQYRLGYKAGASPPETPADATIVYTGTTASTTHTPVASSAYAVFADYNGRGGSSVENSSSGSRVGAFLTT